MENQKQDEQNEIETLHDNIIKNLQHEIILRKKIFNFQKEFPFMLTTLSSLKSDKRLLEKALSKVEVALYFRI